MATLSGTTIIYLVGDGAGTYIPDYTGYANIQCWGAGQAGQSANGWSGAGAYWCQINNYGLTAGHPISFNLGVPGSLSGQAGGDTWFASAPTITAPGGGSSTAPIGTFFNAGGALGGTGASGNPGGGGAGGPFGPGAPGTAGSNTIYSSSGGSGSSKGTPGLQATSSTAGNWGAGLYGAGLWGAPGGGGEGGDSASQTAGGAGGTAASLPGQPGGPGAGGGGGYGANGGSMGAGGAGGDDYDVGGGGGGGGGYNGGAAAMIGGVGGTPGGGAGQGDAVNGIPRGGYGLIKIVHNNNVGGITKQVFYFGDLTPPIATNQDFARQAAVRGVAGLRQAAQHGFVWAHFTPPAAAAIASAVRQAAVMWPARLHPSRLHSFAWSGFTPPRAQANNLENVRQGAVCWRMGLHQSRQHGFIWSDFTPSSLVVPAFIPQPWANIFINPTLRGQQFIAAPVSLAHENITVDKWFQNLSQPYPYRQNDSRPGIRYAIEQRFYVAPAQLQPEVVSLDRYGQDLSQPYPSRVGLASQQHPAYSAPLHYAAEPALFLTTWPNYPDWIGTV